MSDFDLLAQALATWPHHKHHDCRGTIGRVFSAISDLRQQSALVGSGDLAALLAQVMRERYAKFEEAALQLKIPCLKGWPDKKLLELHGVEVVLSGKDHCHIRVLSWRPAWLPGVEGYSPLESTLKGDVRRNSSEVAIDPVLSKRFGLTSYVSPGQRMAIRAALLLEPGKSLLISLPTGTGKSLIPQALALLSESDSTTTVMVVPTTALALDQERRARDLIKRTTGRHIESIAYHSGMGVEEQQLFRGRIDEGNQPLIITSPEAVVTGLRSTLLRCAQAGRLNALVIDEAHLISQWGNEFRPEFQALAGVRRFLLDQCPLDKAFKTILLTATLTQDTWNLLQMLFGTPTLEFVVASHLRPEPEYWVAGAPDKQERQAWVMETIRYAPRPLILYASTKEATEEWYDLLRAAKICRVGMIHGGSTAQERSRELEKWSNGQTDIMVATSAFGLGVDNAEVRTVLHACIPETLDRFYQEVGRAGRDGRACLSVLIHEPGDFIFAKELNTTKVVTVEKGYQRWQSMFHQSSKMSGADEAVGKILVPLDAQPPHIRGDSKSNIKWNLRTLLLMARAGMLELDGAAPPPNLELESDDAPAALDLEGQVAVKKHTASFIVTPTGLDHLDLNIWQTKVEQARQATHKANDESLEQLKQYLFGQQQISGLLEKAYTLNANGRIARPQIVNGQCPVARRMGARPTGYIEPEPIFSGTLKQAIDRRLAAIFAQRSRVLVISIPAQKNITRWREDVLRYLPRLVNCGIREIHASSAWLQLTDYRDLYRHADPPIVLHSSSSTGVFDVEESLAVPRLTIVEPGDRLDDLISSVRCSKRAIEMVMISEDFPDPDRPDRSFLSIHEHSSISRITMELD